MRQCRMGVTPCLHSNIEYWMGYWNIINYMEESVLLGTKPLVDSIRHFIRDPSSVFFVCHLCECRIVQWRHDSRLLLLLNWFLASRLLFRIKSPYNKKNITRWLEDMNFMFEWQEQYLTRSLRSLVGYCSCHSNIKFISSRHRVISSIYYGYHADCMLKVEKMLLLLSCTKHFSLFSMDLMSACSHDDPYRFLTNQGGVTCVHFIYFVKLNT